MSLNGGLNTDVRPYYQPKNSWRYAKNILISKGFNSITNEEGFDLIQTIVKKTIIGVIKLTNDLVVFSTDDLISEIGIIDNNNIYTKIIESKYLKFKKENPIEGVAKRNYNEELIVAWANGLNDSANPPRLVNLSNLPFELDNNLEFINNNDVKLTYLVPDIEIPKIDVSPLFNGGGIPKGSIQFSIAYNYKNQDRTNFLSLTNPISNYFESKDVILKITNLDLSFKSFKLVAINKFNTEINVIEIGDFPIIGTTQLITYSGQNIPTNLILEDIIIPTNTFERVQTITLLKDELIFGNVKTKDINYQCYANNIKVKWDVIDIENTTSEILNLTDEFVLYEKEFRHVHYRTYMPNEVYALYISWVFNDGSVSNGFHIPGREVEPKVLMTTVEINTLTNLYQGRIEKNSDTNTYWSYKEIGNIWLDTTLGFKKDLVNVNTPYDNVIILNDVEIYITYDINIINTLPSIYFDTPYNLYQIYTIELNGNIYNVKSYKRIFIDTINNISKYKIILDTDPNIFNEPLNGQYKFFMSRDYDEDKLLINGETYYLTTLNTYNNAIEKNYLTSQYHIFDTSNYKTLELGYWKNLNERYGNNDNSKICDINNNIIGDLSNKNVRHHKMPSITSIIKRAIDLNIAPTFVSYFDYINNGTISDVQNKYAIGLKLENVALPNELRGKVKGYVLNYAKRDSKNQTIYGNDLLFNNNFMRDNPTKGYSYHDKDLLTFKPSFDPDFIKVNYNQIFHAALDKTIYLVPEYLHTILKLNDESAVSYLPQGSPSSNPDREAHFWVHENIQYFNASSFISMDENNYIGVNVSFYKVLTDIFNSYYIQNLVSTNYLNEVGNQISMNNSKLIFGGDTFLRNDKYDINTDMLIVDTGDPLTNLYFNAKVQQYVFTYISPRFKDNDIAYNSVNDLKSPLPFNPKSIIANNRPYSVYRSLKIFDESQVVGWRTFLANNFYNMPKDKGEIWKLEVLNRTLLIQHKFALFVASIKDVLKSDSITTYLGVGDIFDREPDEITPEDNGYIGCQSKFAAFTCKLGYITVDRNQGKIFIYTGQGLKEISSNGLRNFFRDTLETTLDIDNPFIGMGITICYDEKWDRILITKNIKNKKGEGKYDISFTLSYSQSLNQGQGGWISFHDYIPNYLINTRNKVFSFITNLGKERGDIYLHNIENKKSIYYNNVTYKSFVDIVFLGDSRESKIWEAVYWNSTIITKDNTKLRKETITGILIYNDYQCSGVIDIKNNQSWFLNNARTSDENWVLNEFEDLVIDSNLPFIDNNNELIVSNISKQISWINKNKFIGKFGIVRFIYDNSSQYDFYLNDANFKNRVFNKK